MSVLFPSSTLPAVMNRSKSMIFIFKGAILKVTVLFSVFHRGFRDLVIDACLTAFTRARGRYFPDDIVDLRRGGLHGRRTGHVTDGAVTHLPPLNEVGGVQPDKRRHGHPLALEIYHLPLVGKIDGGQGDLLAADIV